MSVLLLTPNKYRNMKWSITPKDMFDTVSLSPITNAYESEASSIASVDVTTATIDGHTYNLANLGSDLSAFNALKPTYRRNVDNSDLAKARLDVLMYTGAHTFTFTNPISPQSLSASISLEGESAVITDDTKWYFDCPGLADLRDSDYSLASWIEANKSDMQNSLKWRYSPASFVFNPWAYGYGEVYPLGGSTGALEEKYTEWYGAPSVLVSYQGVRISNWEERQTFALNGSRFLYVNAFDDRGGDLGLQITNDIRSIRAHVRKTDDYHVVVSYTVPIRLSYLAVSRYTNFFGVNVNVASNIFSDRVKKITLTLNGLALDTSGNDTSFSLDSTGTAITEQAINKRIYKVEKNELFTLNTYYGNNPAQKWMNYFPLEFLTKYQKGKYLLNLDVPAKWAIENQIHCNSQLKIKLQNNTYIERNSVQCIFEVKTIEKRFKNNEFVFSLGLLEV